MEQNADTESPMILAVDNKQKNGNRSKIVTAIACVMAVCGIGFGIYGMTQGLRRDEGNQAAVILVEPLADIDRWEVDSFTVDDQIIYQASGNSYITDDQEDGWSMLIREIGVVCHIRNPNISSGSTAHTESVIKMKNGDIYRLLWLGNQDQVNITMPDGNTTEYQCYFRG